MRKSIDKDGNVTFKGVPFVVPGGRFNEMYGWDSYFETLGLLVDGKVDLARGMVENFIYEIKVPFPLKHTNNRSTMAKSLRLIDPINYLARNLLSYTTWLC